MRSKRYKLSILVLFCALFLMIGLRGSRARAYSSGPPNGMTGAPGEQNCTTSGCHTQFELNAGPGKLEITGLPTTYSLNQEIDLTITLTQPNRALYGFELTVVDEDGKKAGDLLLLDPNRTQKSSENVVGTVREYVCHTFLGITPTSAGQNSWKVRWKAPTTSLPKSGRVTFYVAGNAANGSGTPLGDFIYTTNASMLPQPSLSPMASVSAASFASTPTLAANSIAAGFGANLASAVVVASTVPLPTTLGGTQILVRDALGTERAAQLFFVSPGQINYLVPAGTAPGGASVSARGASGTIAQGTINVESVAPGLFSANANGQGVASAVVLRRNGAGVDSFEPVAQFNNATQKFEALPLSLGPDTDQLFLLLFGSGFRNLSSLSAASCTIGGAPAEVLFAGAQSDVLAGLDQANIRIPRSLAGRGSVDIVFRVDNKTANTVTIQIK